MNEFQRLITPFLYFAVAIFTSVASFASDATATAPPSTSVNSSTAAITITPFEAHYTARATGIPFSGKVVRKLKFIGDNTYLYSMKAKSFFTTIKESSEFTWIAGKTASDHEETGQPTSTNASAACLLTPNKYRYSRKGIGKDRYRAINFNWSLHKANYINQKEHSFISLQNGITDRLSEHLAIQCHLKAGHTDFKLGIIHRGDTRQHHFMVTGTEIIDTGIGKVKALKVERARQTKDRRSTTFWLAPELDYMLVKLKQEKRSAKDFEKIEQTLTFTLKKLK